MKKPIFFMPGMGASTAIFEKITLPDDYKIHLLKWKMPLKNENLEQYATRIRQEITENRPILVGVSFGAIVMQEVAKQMDYEKLIVISSVTCVDEFPRRMRVARLTKIHKILMFKWLENPKIWDFLSSISKKFRRKRVFYQKYQSITSISYFKWAIDQFVSWKQQETLPRTLHIHGDKDWVFPLKYIKNAIIVKGGSHIMIINRYKWFNEHLPHLLSN